MELHSESTSRVPRNDSAKSIVSSENRNPGCSVQRIFISAMDAINHALIIAVTVFLVCYSAKEHNVTNIHIILCTIGYVLLMSEAIIVLAGDNILTCCLSRRANKHLHWILQAIGLVFNLVGVGLMIDAKKTHFKSIHAILGIASLVIVCTVTIFGYPVWIAWKLRKFVRPVITKFFHNFLGTAGFVIGMASQCYGYKKGIFDKRTETDYADTVLLIFTVLIVILSLRGALVSLISQAKGRHVDLRNIQDEEYLTHTNKISCEWKSESFGGGNNVITESNCEMFQAQAFGYGNMPLLSSDGV